MICDTCKKEMNYFIEGQSCGWKCNSCGNLIVTTYYDEFEIDTTMYSISISPVIKPSVMAIKGIAKICNCSFINAKELLVSGSNLGEFNAKKAKEIFCILNELEIHYQSSPEFKHNL